MTASRVIFENGPYVACALRDGSLTVQHRRTGKGVRLIPNIAAPWTDAIEGRLDDAEGRDICRALYTGSV